MFRSATFFLLAAFSVPAPAATVLIGPTDDTTVHSFQPDNTLYGSAPGLGAGGVFNGAEQWVAFLRFDLGAVPVGQTITGATLHMFQSLGGGYAPIGSRIYRVANDAWSESTATWNNPPASVAEWFAAPIAANDNAGTTYRGWSAWDLLASGSWNPAADLADGVLSVAAYSNTYSGTQTHNWCSKESDLGNCLISGETEPVAALRRPYLELTYVPLPGAAWMLGAVVPLLLPQLRRRRRVA